MIFEILIPHLHPEDLASKTGRLAGGAIRSGYGVSIPSRRTKIRVKKRTHLFPSHVRTSRQREDMITKRKTGKAQGHACSLLFIFSRVSKESNLILDFFQRNPYYKMTGKMKAANGRTQKNDGFRLEACRNDALGNFLAAAANSRSSQTRTKYGYKRSRVDQGHR